MAVGNSFHIWDLIFVVFIYEAIFTFYNLYLVGVCHFPGAVVFICIYHFGLTVEWPNPRVTVSLDIVSKPPSPQPVSDCESWHCERAAEPSVREWVVWTLEPSTKCVTQSLWEPEPIPTAERNSVSVHCSRLILIFGTAISEVWHGDIGSPFWMLISKPSGLYWTTIKVNWSFIIGR